MICACVVECKIKAILWERYFWIYTTSNEALGADHLIRGGGGLWFFLRDQTFFLTPSLNVQFFSDLTKSKQFFSQQ